MAQLSNSSIGSGADFNIALAEKIVYDTYGDKVSVLQKAKPLFKFGRRPDVNTNEQTIMDLPSGQYHEDYVSDNTIAYISSSDNSDTEVITYEYHTIDGNGDFTFGIDTVTLVGNTKTALPTPCARISRAYVAGGTVLAGTVYFYEDDTTSGTPGVPDNGDKVHLIVAAGFNQSNKAATTISKDDYYFIKSGFASLARTGTSPLADVNFEIRLKGSIFRKQFPTSVSSGANNTFTYYFEPLLIIPKNADVRVVCTGSTSNITMSAGFNGYLAKIIS